MSLDVAAPADGDDVDAFGIEECECPDEYAGLSCQVTCTSGVWKGWEGELTEYET